MNIDKILSRHKCYGQNCEDIVPFKYSCKENPHYRSLLPMRGGNKTP